MDPVLTVMPDNGARVFAVNPDGSVGSELFFTEGHGFTLPASAAAVAQAVGGSNQTGDANANATAAAAAAGNNNATTTNGTATTTNNNNNNNGTVVVASHSPPSSSSEVPRSVAVVPGAMFYLRVADARRGTVTLKWRARDAAGVLSAREGVVTVTSACRAGYRRASFWWDPDQCFPCPAGRFNQDDAVDQEGCAPCDPGSFAPHAASTRCHLCPSSQFADKSGMDTCDVCADLSGGGMMTVSSGSSSRRQCLCPQGTWVNSGDIAAVSRARSNSSSSSICASSTSCSSFAFSRASSSCSSFCAFSRSFFAFSRASCVSLVFSAALAAATCTTQPVI